MKLLLVRRNAECDLHVNMFQLLQELLSVLVAFAQLLSHLLRKFRMVMVMMRNLLAPWVEELISSHLHLKRLQLHAIKHSSKIQQGNLEGYGMKVQSLNWKTTLAISPEQHLLSLQESWRTIEWEESIQPSS